MISYSIEAQYARAHLLSSYNDIDVFVEDATCQNMYVRLFQRILKNEGTIQNVFPLYGRKNILESCSGDQAARPRRRLYIIDGDQDLLLERPMAPLNHLYRLSVYCSENLLLSEQAFVTVATECQIDTPAQQMREDLLIRNLMEEVTTLLLPLFVVYGLVAYFRLELETVNYPVHRLLQEPGNPNSLSRKLIRRRILDLLCSIHAQVDREEYRRIRNKLVSRLQLAQGDRAVFVSAKSYLLPLAHLRLKRIARHNESTDCLKVRLSQHCDLNIDNGLANALRTAINLT